MTSDAARRWTGRLRALVTGVPFLVTASAIVVLVAVYTLAGFFLVPRLIATYVPRYAQEQLGRRAEIGEVRANPLLFRLEIKDFRLQEADGRPLLGFDRLFVDFQLSSLFRAAWTFAEIQLEEPRLDVVLYPDGRLNVGELLDAFPRGEPDPRPEAKAPPRVLLQHAVVRGGRLSFTDLSGRAPQTAVVDPLDVELRDIATLRDRRGPYAISATLIGGGTVGWDGEVSLFPLGSTGRVGIRGFPLATAWRFVQGQVALAEPAGRVDADVRYQLAYRDGATSATVDGLEVVVAGLVLTERGDKTPLLALDRIHVTGGSGDLVARELTVPEISVSRGRLAATMDRGGTVNWQKLLIGPQPQAAGPDAGGTPVPTAGAAPARGVTNQAPTARPPAGVRPWRIALEKVRVEDVALSFNDQSRAAPYELDVAGVSLDLSARLESGPAGLTGTAKDVDVKLSRVAVRDATAARTPLASLDGISVEGGRVDLGRRQVAVSRVAATGGTTTVIRAADGSIPVLTMLRPADQSRDQSRSSGRPSAPASARPSAPPGARPAPAAATRPWTVALAKLDLASHRLAVADRSVTPAVELELDRINVSLREMHSDGRKAWPFDASLRVKQGGRFTAKGHVAPDGRAADVTLTLTQLALTPAQPYVARTAAVRLVSGSASSKGRLTYRAGPDRAAVTYTGSADVDGVRVVEEATGNPVLAWKSAHARNLRFRLAPDRLEIDELRLTELDGSVVILEDRSLSLARLMKGPGSPSAGDPADTAAASPAEGNATPRFPVVVDRVRIDNSSMHFGDLSLVLPFTTRVHALNGVVAGLGSDPGNRATVKLDGQVDEFGLLKVDGAITPFDPKLFTDLDVIFRGVPMPTLTPYSATFAGRRIVAGMMDLELEYKIERSALVGDHKIVLRRLQLGERVESAGAMRLPLDLAIAILSDSEGRIEITLPVRGHVDRPEFSYRDLIWQALVSVIRRIVTSPFRALAGLFGGDGERLETIAFEAGRDVVLPPERGKLARVAEVLGKRPRLKLTVHGGYEATVDGEALRSFRVRQELAKRLGVELSPGEDPGPVAFDHAKTQRALEAMLNERAGSSAAIDEFETSYEKRTGKKAQRANPVLALLNRGSADRAFYEALFRRLVETASLADAELKNLGRRRGEAVARVIQQGAGTAGARVEVGDTEAASRVEKNAVPTRLELGAAGS